MSKAGMKLTQSLINDTLTITTLTYAATAAINSDANDVAPNGMPNTISVITPVKNIKPYPKIFGVFKTQ